MPRRSIFSISIFAILGACAGQVAQSVDVDSASYRGDPVTLRSGDTLRVLLRSNPTTGYVWTRGAAAPDGLVLIDSTFTPPAGTAVGAPGQQQFRFLASQPGRATLRLVYVRPWETGVQPVDSIRIDLTVTAR